MHILVSKYVLIRKKKRLRKRRKGVVGSRGEAQRGLRGQEGDANLVVKIELEKTETCTWRFACGKTC